MVRNEQTNPADEKGAPAPEGAEQQPRTLVSRRALLVRAGWVVPAVLTLHLPSNAFAQYAGTCLEWDVWVDDLGVEHKTCVKYG